MGGLSCRPHWGFLPPSAPCWDGHPPKKYSRSRSREGGGPRFPPTGSLPLDISVLVEALSPVLCSSKVTCFLGLTGLEEGACLFAGSPLQPTTEGTCSCWLTGRHLLWFLIPLLLCEWWWLAWSPMAARLPSSDRVAQSLDVTLQQGGYHQCLMVGFPSYPQGLLM